MNLANKKHIQLTLAAALATMASGAYAAQPDAGNLMGTVRPPEAAPLRMAPAIEVQEPVRPAMPASKVKVKVQAFKISGNKAFSSETLLALLTPYAGQELDFASLNKAIASVSQYYRENGYFVARAYLPEQQVVAGIVEVAVVEGRLDKVTIKPSGETRLNKEVAVGVVSAAATPGEAIHESKIERGLLLLNDMPGMEVKSTIVPGATPGTSDLMVEAKEGQLVTGGLDADNYGNRFTGTLRAGANVALNNPLGIGDQVSGRFMTSGGGMNYGRVGYALPVGYYGTKVGAAYSNMNYSLKKDFSSLGAKGTAGIVSLYALHPFERSRNSNIYGSVGYDRKAIRDDQNTGNTQDKRINSGNLGLSGDNRDGLGGGGLNNWGINLVAGKVDLGRNATAANNDATTAQSNGSYTKASYNASRLQWVTDRVSVYGAFSGQFASKNLDSSEKFILGGLGVRAYPVGEAPGDEGYLLNLEARYNMPGIDIGELQLVGFVDHGGVTLHKKTWTNWQPTGLPNYPNSYSLSGAGVGVNFQKVGLFSMRASYARKIGSNPATDTLGRDSDNTSDPGRFWVQATTAF